MTKILLGVSGGIAAYKSCELVREFRRRGADVRVMMTPAAQHFVSRLTFEALTQSSVLTDMFGDHASGTSHIEAARWADTIVLAPATANRIAKLAHGIADDAVSTICLAFRGSVVAAPAMNTAMWDHPAFQANLATLRSRNVGIVPPETAALACGEVGIGKMADPVAIADFVLGREHPSPLRGKRTVITAGPTREYLDPVRFLSSPSTGKMGLAVAREAVRRGANVTVIHGPLSEEPDFLARFLPVTSAAEMAERVGENTPSDLFIATAAVADYRPANPAASKIKKNGEPLRIDLEPTDDILASVSKRRRPGDLVVGFAAETDEIEANARRKLAEKNLDLIVANRVNRELLGFARSETSVTIIDRKGLRILPNVTKREVAAALLDRIEELL
jgi:phosphopantothenoylcysteine decarboxylase/phosphopantothenate--cysteine ligase